MTVDLFALGGWPRVAFVVILAILAHLCVMLARWLARWIMSARYPPQIAAKVRTVSSLCFSVLVFAIYFSAFGMVLSEFGVSLTTYFASTTIIGLAVGFGSQGLVQDVVMGLTAIFTDLFDIGEVVEVSGQVGVVEHIGMRFTTLRNAFGAHVMIPNRLIANVVQYPRGYIRCFADVTIAADPDVASKMEAMVQAITAALLENYAGIFRAPAEFVGVQRSGTGRRFVRVKFRIWPGRGAPIEGGYKQEIVQALKALDPNYADWMVSVNYEVEEAPPSRWC